MTVDFMWNSKQGDESERLSAEEAIRDDLSRELDAEHLVVHLSDSQKPFCLDGVATSAEGTPLRRFSFLLLQPRNATYLEM